MAHKKAGGSTRNGRDSESKRLGVKRFGGEAVNLFVVLRQCHWPEGFDLSLTAHIHAGTMQDEQFLGHGIFPV